MHQPSTLILNNGNSPVEIDFLVIKKASVVLRALNHNLRYEILKLIEENQPIHVANIYKNLKIEQSVASKNLAVLRRAGIVIKTRNGRNIYYTPNYDNISKTVDLIAKMTE